jgi:predicted aspartyl protease
MNGKRLRMIGACAIALTAAPWSVADPLPDVLRAPVTSVAPAPGVAPAEDLTEIVVEAPEPRYVAPTRRDRIGRIWAPVYINEKGPFRLVLDTGASRSGIIARVATALGIEPDDTAAVRLHGVTGIRVVPTVLTDSLRVGDVLLKGSRLPIIEDALGGAEGILGNEGLGDRRVLIDFRHDLIIISRSHLQRAAQGFRTIPFTLERGRLLVADVRIGPVGAKAIIDTGAQSTVANLALRDALIRRRDREQSTPDSIEGVTTDIQEGEWRQVPAIEFGPIEIQIQHMTFVDASIFGYWKLWKDPAVLIGMDALGTLDTLIIDYRRRELQLLMRTES